MLTKNITVNDGPASIREWILIPLNKSSIELGTRRLNINLYRHDKHK